MWKMDDTLVEAEVPPLAMALSQLALINFSGPEGLDWALILLASMNRSPNKASKSALTLDDIATDVAVMSPRSLDSLAGADWVGLHLRLSAVLPEALKLPNCKIRELDASGFGLTSSTVSGLGHALARNRSLRVLRLARCSLAQDKDVPLLIEALTVNSTLRILDLRQNGFNRAAVTMFEPLMCINITLRSLLIEENGVDLVMTATPTPSQPDTPRFRKTLSSTPRGSMDRRRARTVVRSSSRGVASPLPCVPMASILGQNARFALVQDGQSTSLSLVMRSLMRMPKALLSLTSLVTLNVSHNQMSSIDGIQRLYCLEELDVSHNALQSLPSHLYKLTRLRNLHLGNNRLTQLSEAVCMLPSLTSLDVKANLLDTLPLSLGTCTRLTSLILFSSQGTHGNPLSGVPKAYHSNDAILPWLHQRIQAYTPSRRIKVIFSGAGGVGKTSTIRCLAGITTVSHKKGSSRRRSVHPDRSYSLATDGIEITKLQARTTDKDMVDMACWDFGGQDVYRNTHTFFMTARTIYVLVFNLLEDSLDEIAFWLASVAVRVPQSAVILVGTHMDAKGCTTSHVKAQWARVDQILCTRFTNIQARCSVSTVTGEGIRKLKKTILDVARRQAYIYEQIPFRFLAVEQKLAILAETTDVPVMDWEAFTDLVQETGLRADDAGLVAGYLRDLGVLLHFPDHSALKETIFLDAQWLMDMFSAVLSVKQRAPVISRARLSMLLQSPSYPESIHETLVSLLTRFDIAFWTPDRESLIVPALFPAEAPAHFFQQYWPPLQYPADRLKRAYSRYYFFDFLPHGFQNLVMVRLLRFGWAMQVGWRYGIVMDKARESLLMEAVPSEHMLRITIRSVGSSRLVLSLIEGIGELMEEWLEVNVRVHIPCVHCLSRGAAEKPSMWSIEELEALVAQGRFFVTCPRGSLPVSIRLLAPDIQVGSSAQQVRLEDIEIGPEVGAGGFASVFKGKWNGREVAVKRLFKDSISEERKQGDKRVAMENFTEFRQEVFLMSGLEHPNLVCLLGVCLEPFSMVLEYMNGGTLFDYLHDAAKPLPPLLQVSWALDVSHGMRFLHEAEPPVVHRDLKSLNILLHRVPGSDRFVAKVADFGLSRNVVFAGRKDGSRVDNPLWVAPEVLRQEPVSAESDVYSFGIVLWELWSRKQPFPEYSFMTLVEEAILAGVRPTFEAHAMFSSLATRCWQHDPMKRPTFGAIQDHLRTLLRLCNVTRSWSHQVHVSASAERDFCRLQRKASVPNLRQPVALVYRPLLLRCLSHRHMNWRDEPQVHPETGTSPRTATEATTTTTTAATAAPAAPAAPAEADMSTDEKGDALNVEPSSLARATSEPPKHEAVSAAASGVSDAPLAYVAPVQPRWTLPPDLVVPTNAAQLRSMWSDTHGITQPHLPGPIRRQVSRVWSDLPLDAVGLNAKSPLEDRLRALLNSQQQRALFERFLTSKESYNHLLLWQAVKILISLLVKGKARDHFAKKMRTTEEAYLSPASPSYVQLPTELCERFQEATLTSSTPSLVSSVLMELKQWLERHLETMTDDFDDCLNSGHELESSMAVVIPTRRHGATVSIASTSGGVGGSGAGARATSPLGSAQGGRVRLSTVLSRSGSRFRVGQGHVRLRKRGPGYSGSMVKSGVLHMKDSNGRWKQRWVVLTDLGTYWFKASESKEARGCVTHAAGFRVAGHVTKSRVFALVSVGVIREFKAASVESRNAWTDALLSHVHRKEPVWDDMNPRASRVVTINETTVAPLEGTTKEEEQEDTRGHLSSTPSSGTHSPASSRRTAHMSTSPTSTESLSDALASPITSPVRSPTTVSPTQPRKQVVFSDDEDEDGESVWYAIGSDSDAPQPALRLVDEPQSSTHRCGSCHRRLGVFRSGRQACANCLRPMCSKCTTSLGMIHDVMGHAPGSVCCVQCWPDVRSLVQKHVDALAAQKEQDDEEEAFRVRLQATIIQANATLRPVFALPVTQGVDRRPVNDALERRSLVASPGGATDDEDDIHATPRAMRQAREAAGVGQQRAEEGGDDGDDDYDDNDDDSCLHGVPSLLSRSMAAAVRMRSHTTAPMPNRGLGRGLDKGREGSGNAGVEPVSDSASKRKGGSRIKWRKKRRSYGGISSLLDRRRSKDTTDERNVMRGDGRKSSDLLDMLKRKVLQMPGEVERKHSMALVRILGAESAQPRHHQGEQVDPGVSALLALLAEVKRYREQGGGVRGRDRRETMKRSSGDHPTSPWMGASRRRRGTVLGRGRFVSSEAKRVSIGTEVAASLTRVWTSNASAVVAADAPSSPDVEEKGDDGSGGGGVGVVGNGVSDSMLSVMQHWRCCAPLFPSLDVLVQGEITLIHAGTHALWLCDGTGRVHPLDVQLHDPESSGLILPLVVLHRRQSFRAHVKRVCCSCTIWERNEVWTGDESGTIAAWTSPDAFQVHHVAGAHDAAVISVVWNGSHVMSSASNGYIHVWEPNECRCLLRLRAGASSLQLHCWSPGRLLLRATDTGNVCMTCVPPVPAGDATEPPTTVVATVVRVCTERDHDGLSVTGMVVAHDEHVWSIHVPDAGAASSCESGVDAPVLRHWIPASSTPRVTTSQEGAGEAGSMARLHLVEEVCSRGNGAAASIASPETQAPDSRQHVCCVNGSGTAVVCVQDGMEVVWALLASPHVEAAAQEGGGGHVTRCPPQRWPASMSYTLDEETLVWHCVARQRVRSLALPCSVILVPILEQQLRVVIVVVGYTDGHVQCFQQWIPARPEHDTGDCGSDDEVDGEVDGVGGDDDGNVGGGGVYDGDSGDEDDTGTISLVASETM